MALDSVPWFVGGGAQHSPEVARLLAYAATGGATGIVTPGDLKVRSLATPGTSVRVAPGAAIVPNRGSGGAEQSYIARNATETTAAIAATGSSGGRSDLVVLRVEDPYMAGEPWQNPSNPAVGPYVFIRVIPNVGAGTTRMPAGQSGIPLARIDIPANTGTITDTMIVDLRTLAQPRQSRHLLFAGLGGNVTSTTTGSYSRWPNYAPQIRVPDWATHAEMIVNVNGALQYATQARVDGVLRGHIGSIIPGAVILDYDAPNDGVRHTISCAVGANVVALRGTLITLELQANMGRGSLTADGGTQCAFDISFSEQAV